MVSTSYPASDEDWRGRFIADLVRSLSLANDISLSLWAPPGNFPPGVGVAMLPEESAWIQNLTVAGGVAYLLRNRGLRGLGMIVGLLLRLRRVYLRNRGVDVVHVNWLQNSLPLWRMDLPAVISVLGSDYGLLRMPGMKMLLRLVLSQRKCILAPNAEWMAPSLVAAFGDIAEVRPIPFGVNKVWFAVERKFSGEASYPWLVVSRVTHNKIGDLFDWGEGLFDKQHSLHLLGPMQESLTLPPWVHYEGPTNPTELREKWFPMAAGLITLSRHDEGRPQVMLEAMAAGLPIIASDLLAHRDCVRNQQTGFLVGSREDFRAALEYLYSADNNRQMGRAARDWAVQQIGDWEDCARKYAAAYRTVARKKA